MNFEWIEHSAAELEAERVLLIQDGNHGNDRPRREEFVDDGVAFIRAADLENGTIRFDRASRINERALKRIRKGIGAPGDVILSHKGTVGRVALAPLGSEDFVCSPQTTFWRTLDERRLDRRYLYYFLQGPFFRSQLNAIKGETDMADYVSLTNQRQLRVVVPPIDEQRRIASVLQALENKVAIEAALESELTTMMRLRFKHDVVGRIADVPAGWDVGALPDIARFINGRAITKEANGLGRPIIRIRELKSGIDESTPFTDVDVADENRAAFGDLLFAWSGSLGAYRWRGVESAINQHIFKVVPRDVPLWFVEQWLDYHMDEFRTIAADKATTMGHIQRHHLDEARVLIPPSDQLEELDRFFRPADARRTASARLVADLVQLRDELLPRLIMGHLRVPESYDPDGTVASFAQVRVGEAQPA